MTNTIFYAKIYRVFKYGAGLRTEDVRRLLLSRGHDISNNALREFGRNSDRGGMMTAAQLHDLISAWADEMRSGNGS